MAELLRKAESVWRKELGRRTGRRSSLIEQTPSPNGYPEKRWGTKKVLKTFSAIVFT